MDEELYEKLASLEKLAAEIGREVEQTKGLRLELDQLEQLNDKLKKQA